VLMRHRSIDLMGMRRMELRNAMDEDIQEMRCLSIGSGSGIYCVI